MAADGVWLYSVLGFLLLCIGCRVHVETRGDFECNMSQ